MKTLTVSVLKGRLKQTAWLPIAIITVTLLGAMSFVMKQEFDEKIKNTTFALSDVVKYRQEFFVQDILLNQPQGVEARLSSLLLNWQQKYPGIQACVAISFKAPRHEEKSIEKCAIDSGKPGTIFAGHPGDSIEINDGGDRLATIQYVVLRNVQMADVLPPILIVTLLLALIGAGISHYVLVRRVENTILNPLLDKISEDERTAAIAETSQMLAHDIRKPLQAIRMALRNMVESSNQTVRAIGEKVSLDVEGSVRAINAMLEDIIDASREIRLNKEEISVREVVSGAAEAILRLYPDTVVTTIYKFESESTVMADREKVCRVVSNLIENAVQAIGDRGTLRVEVEDVLERGNPFVRISVGNDGPAIESEDLPKLFAPFFTKKTKGTGLGLAIAKKIVETHGGAIACSSSKADGTVFSFDLPAKEPKESVSPVSLVTNDPGLQSFRERTVLVFDDENSVHKAWKEHGEKCSFLTLCHFKSWEDFVAQDGFSLVKDSVAFVDIYYKGSKSDGLDIARALRKLGARKIYAITSAKETAQESGLFDAVFGKEIPDCFDYLVA